ncbi:sialate O-acetylesterase [Klebsiella pneumoniae]|uniref:sialate O-acetylesterase n=1 Tax=Klebsiella pneumoniae TaxID=573 RepID=UPI0010846DC3|nr:sialate O-acetylesterase [Klebsiella pneumoniae]VGF74183.1 flagellar biosynthesis, cell-distal portion of basal-body rod [Klebsiella pneumoniae]
MAYVPPVGETTDPDIFMDNVKRADELVNGPAGTVDDRGGEPLDTWREMMAKNDEVRQNLIPLSKQYMTLEAAQADIANIPEGSTAYVRSADGSALADEYINNGGTLEATGRTMPSQQAVDSVQEQVSDIRDDVSTVRGGMGNYIGESMYPLAADANDNMVMWYDPVTDEIQGNGLVTESNIGKTVQAVPGARVYKGSSLTPVVTDSQNKVLLGYDADNDEMQGVGLVSNSTMNDGYSAKKFTGNTVYPLLTDSQNKVLLGYDADNDEMQGVGLVSNSTMNDGYSAKKFTGNTVYPLLTDSQNKVLLGYDAAADQIIAVGLESQGAGPTYLDSPLPYTPVAKAVNQLVGYGQSLMAGATSRPPISLTQPYSNLTYIGGTRGGGLNTQDFSAFKPLVEDEINPAPDGGNNRGETVCSGMANYATYLAYAENGIAPSSHVLLISSAGKSGAPISELKKGTEWYNSQFTQHLTRGFDVNPDLAIQCIPWVQGESNSDGRAEDGTRSAYRGRLRQLRIDAEADAKAKTGQTTPVPMIVYQHSTNIRTNTNTALAFYDLITEKDSLFFFATPTYMFPHAVDTLHLTAVGYKWMGCYFGRAYKQMMHDRIRPRFIHPISATYVGGVIRWKFNVPQAPLVLDTANLAPTQDYGFSVYSGGVKVAIISVSIENGDTVVIDTGESSLSSVVVKYGIDYLGTGLNIQSGASGNLRDSTPDTVLIAGEKRPLFYLCPHLEFNAINGAI